MFILWLPITGGLLCGLYLTLAFLGCLAARKPHAPWSVTLGLGWLSFVIGAILMCIAQFTPLKNYSWQDGWGNGFMLIGLGFWWISFFAYRVERKHRNETPIHHSDKPTKKV